MLAAIGPISASLGLVSNIKKASDVFATMASESLPDEGFIILWRMLDSTGPALELCTKLASRHGKATHCVFATSPRKQVLFD